MQQLWKTKVCSIIQVENASPLVLDQSKETSVTTKSTSNGAICSLRISRCLIRNNWASTDSYTVTHYNDSLIQALVFVYFNGSAGREKWDDTLRQSFVGNTLKHRFLEWVHVHYHCVDSHRKRSRPALPQHICTALIDRGGFFWQ